MEKKISTSVEALCEGIPSDFATYIRYCRNLTFDEKPDYDYCRKLINTLMTRANYQTDYVYDWNIVA